METHVQLYKEGVYGGWQIYSRSRGPAALAWETEAMLTCTCHCPHQSIHTSLSTPGKLNIRAVVPVQVPEWFLRLQPKPIYTRVLCTSTIIVVRISRVYSVDRAIGWYILRQQIETNPLPNIDTCGATLTPFHAPLHHVNLISFY